jgi:hypothetical protein
MGMPVRRSQKSRPAAGPSLLLFAARHLDGRPVGSRDAALVSLSRRGAYSTTPCLPRERPGRAAIRDVLGWPIGALLLLAR